MRCHHRPHRCPNHFCPRQRFDQLVALTCVQPQVQKAVPSSTPEPQEYTYDSTSLYDTSGAADSYGIVAGDTDPDPSPVATPIGRDRFHARPRTGHVPSVSEPNWSALQPSDPTTLLVTLTS